MLVTAALEEVISDQNAANVRARVVVEGGTVQTRQLQTERGVPVVPDIAANAGEFVVSFFERVDQPSALVEQGADHAAIG